MDSVGNNNAEIFDPTKEKKKKKKKVLDLDSVLLGSTASSATAPSLQDDDTATSGDKLEGTTGSGGGDGEQAPDGSGGHDDILESLETFGSKKKKKKVKKVLEEDISEVIGVEGVGGGEEEQLDFDFSKTKKKKKKGGVAALDELVAKVGDEIEGESIVIVEDNTDNLAVATAATATAENDDGGGGVTVERAEDDDDGIFDKQTSSNNVDDNDDDDQGDEGDEDQNENDAPVTVSAPQAKSWLSSDRDYTYDELLTRVFEIMRAKNPEMVSGTKQKFVMRPPQVVRIGTKKTSFVNFMEICKMLHRHQKHLLDFLLSELGTSGSIDGNNQLIIKGRFQQKQIENVLRRYIKEYVTCHTCKSPNTLLQKDFRLFFLQCEACGSRCSVASIKHGFQAVTGKRAAMRAKAN